MGPVFTFHIEDVDTKLALVEELLIPKTDMVSLFEWINGEKAFMYNHVLRCAGLSESFSDYRGMLIIKFVPCF